MDDMSGAALAVGGVVRAPSAERRAAAGVHPVLHSIGLVLTTDDPGHGEFSFRVTADGDVAEAGGWGWAGPIPALEGVNGPPNPLAVHTVLVEAEDDVASLVALRHLVEEHNDRYGECSVWVSGAGGVLVAWAAAGCPEPWLSPVEE